MRRSFQRPKMGVIAAAVALATGPSPSAAVNWTGGTSFWDLASNWSSNPLLPGAADDVLIDVAGVQTVTHRSGTNTISSFALTGDDFFTLSGGSLTVANAFGSATLTNLSGAIRANKEVVTLENVEGNYGEDRFFLTTARIRQPAFC